MKWAKQIVRHVCGLDDEFNQDDFNKGATRSRFRIKIISGVAAIAGITLIVFAIITSSISSAVTKVELSPELSPTLTPSSSFEKSSFGSVLIHVVGEVHSPGIYELEVGSRVIDAVMSAGGLTETASECGINLAREIKDGEQLSIPSLIDGCTASAGPGAQKALSLNQATIEQLDSLPGIGPTLAERIVSWRETQGGFTSIEQLNDVSGIGDKLFAGLKDLVTL